MANVEPKHWASGKHRYTIQQLLALSGRQHPFFDLSKFTFDAARAGVIPSLGECATSSRRSSATRRHASLGKGVCAMDGACGSVNREAVNQEYCPRPPPLSTFAQQNTGFARFLKKHTSPTHQRVTAGGRIVPMESRPPPPPFSLVTKSRNNPQDREQVSPREPNFSPTTCASGTNEVSFAATGRSAYAPPFRSLQQNSSEGLLSFRETCYANGCTTDSFETPSANLESISDPVACYPSFMPTSQNPTQCAGYMPGNVNTYNPWQQFNPTSNMAAYPLPATWLCDGAVEAGRPVLAGSSTQLAQPILWAQNALSEWNFRYNELDVQLKALDRHRAMTSLTSDIANQRREIVQQRSDSKNMMNLISTWLSLSQHIHPDSTLPSTTTNFNVDAPTYTPAFQNNSCVNSEEKSCQRLKDVASIQPMSRPPARSVRRPIPIVAPPKLETNSTLAKSSAVTLLDDSSNDDVDPWGVKIGLAPPELRKQQSDLLESMSDAQSQTSFQNTSQESLRSAPVEGFFHQSASDTAKCRGEAHITEDKEQIIGETEPDPQDIEKIYEESLDALRKPRGTVTTIAIPDGFDMQIEGQELQRPSSQAMSRFEKDYWDRKPMAGPAIVQEGQHNELLLPERTIETPVHQMTLPHMSESTKSCHNAGLNNNNKENFTVSPAVHRKAATDAFLIRFNSSEDQNDTSVEPCGSRPGCYLSGKGHILQQPIKHLGADRVYHSDMSSPTHSAKLRSGLCNGEDNYPSIDQSQSLYRTPERGFNNTSMETFNNKGFSSISVQNVNVVARLPHNLDGTTDHSKGPRSILRLIGKVKSPRRMRHTTATGGAWYGPHCREAIERALSDSSVVGTIENGHTTR